MSRAGEQFDVVVIGGGPGGSTAATLIAMQGHRVVLLEKETTPIYKVGESLLPSTIHGICPMLGVSEEIKRANFVRKQGGSFRWGKRKDVWTFTFSDSSAMQSPTAYAYQVERMKFDAILLANARRKSVDVREQHSVIDLLIENGRVGGVVCSGGNDEWPIRAKYVLDASGHSSMTAKHAGERVYSQFFRNVSVFGYFQHGKRLAPPNSGNIFCAAFEKGWFWYIPLSADLTSVGAVIGQEHAQLLQQGHATALKELISACPPISELLRDAEPATQIPYNDVRVRKDYSYSHTHFWRPGLALIGDAACFIDPVFSSGVHLATYSALVAARSVNSCLRNLVDEEKAFGEFENRYRREYRYFYDFLMAFYDIDQDLETYYWDARKVTNSEERGNEAFIRLVAGMAGSGERLFSNASEFMSQRAGISKSLFPETPGQGIGRARDERGAKFMTDFTAELAQMQLQAAMKKVPPYQQPLFEGGLIPSRDGFHWAPATQSPAAKLVGGIR
jgi:halogenation protein CepH